MLADRLPAGVVRLRRACLLCALLLALAGSIAACGSDADTAPTKAEDAAQPGPAGEGLLLRFLIGGWLAPKGGTPEEDPFEDTLVAVAITTDQEMEDFLDTFDLLRLRGAPQALDRADLSEVVVLAAYYRWRPLKGDPMFMESARLQGNKVIVDLELVDDPPGHESPMLLSPLEMGSIDREALPQGVPLEVEFRLNGEAAVTQVVTLSQ